jgi:Protein of unknown function (DUF1566)
VIEAPSNMLGVQKVNDSESTTASHTGISNSGTKDGRYVFSNDQSEVTDTKSGITWRRCAEGMQWSEQRCTGQARNFSGLSAALQYEKTVGGWRLPTIDELITVGRDQPFHANAKISRDSIGAAFPGLPSGVFWSSTLYYKDRGDRDRTKVIYFFSGQEGFRDNGEGGYLLLVKKSGSRSSDSTSGGGIPVTATTGGVSRQASAVGATRYLVSGDGAEVTDTTTGLIWRRCAEGMSASGNKCVGKALTFDFAGAFVRASSQAKVSKKGWRVPNKEELLSIGDEKRFTMAIDITTFPGTPPDHFWTSHRTDAENAYAVNFYNAYPYTRYYTNSHYLRLVRESQ